MSDPPLQIKCTDSECEADLHCFRPKSWKTPETHPRCRDCGADLVEWDRLHRRDLEDSAFLFSELPKELVRHHFWHCKIPERTRRSAEHFSREVIAHRTRKAIRARVADAADEWDGTQTAMDPEKGAQIYHFGMHATACCCRKCMQYWHGIPRERPLTEDELEYFSMLVWLYVCMRMGWPESEGLIENVD